MKVFVKTFGCQMNEQDSEIMKGLLAQKGFEEAGRPEEADLILINTCSVREKAYQKAMSEIGRRRGRDGVLLGVTGCVVSQAGESLLKKFPDIDLLIGPDRLQDLPRLVEEARSKKKKGVAVDFQDISDYEFPALPEGFRTEGVKAYVTIMKGCDNVCSFCIVPLTRGREVSRPPEAILEEIRKLERQGVREVTLLGQNVNSYGKKSEGIRFPELLRQIDEETTIDRVRYTSPHPKDLSAPLIAEYGHNRRLCPHIHLPAQSGSNRVLKRMRRAYTRESYLRKVERLRKIRPDIAVTTDLIVGFPGETEEDFRETLSLVGEVGYDQSYSFMFSPRPGTEAGRFVDDVSLEEKKERLYRLQALQSEISRGKNRARVGEVEEVLVEGPSLEGRGQLTGRTLHGRIVNFVGGAERIGDILKIKIREASPFSLRGEIDDD